MAALGLLAAAYLLGSVPFGYLCTRRLRGLDVRQQGSGNIGATNVARVAGKKLGALVLVLDALKGALPVAAAVALWPDAHRLHAGVGLSAVLGHVFPVWLRLRGGKGVATSFGVAVVLVPWSALAGLVVHLLVTALTRLSSLGSLLAGLTLVAVALAVAARVEYVAGLGALFLLVLFTHRGNLLRLLRRTERKL